MEKVSVGEGEKSGGERGKWVLKMGKLCDIIILAYYELRKKQKKQE